MQKMKCLAALFFATSIPLFVVVVEAIIPVARAVKGEPHHLEQLGNAQITNKPF